MHSIPRSVLAVLQASALAACAGVQVRSVGTNTGQPAFDLTGPSLDPLVAEAQRLCPQGHAVMRQWQRTNRPAGAGDATTNWAYATGVLSYDLQPEQARMSIVCRAAGPA